MSVLPKVSKAFGNINAYPNPFSGNFALSFNLLQDDAAQVVVYDVNGRIVYQRKFDNLIKGNNLLKITPQNSLTAGIYLVKISLLKQNESKVLKLIKL